MMSLLRIVLTCLLVSNIAADNSCVPQTAEYGIVCVCNATYCDTAGTLPDLAAGEYAVIATSESGQRFNVTKGNTTLSHIPHNMVDPIVFSVTTVLSVFTTLTYMTVDPRITYQTIEGFGGTFTDSAGMNILDMSSEAQENLLKSYFGADGLDYNMGRVPIGGTNFSPRTYAYNDYPVNDTNLSNFTLAEEDYNMKIPLIKRAQALASDEIILQAATWSPPVWMKTNNAYGGYSFLKEEYYHTYALYHLKFLEEYNKENITIHALSTGNQPIVDSLGDILDGNSLGWIATEQGEWLLNHFGPVIKESEFNNTKIYVLDEQTVFIYDMLPLVLQNKEVLKYVDGVAIHWYLDTATNLSLMNNIYDLLGNTSIINTEASQGVIPSDLGIKIGQWSRAQQYLEYIIKKMHYNLNGWIDWNLAVNLEGGPSWNNSTIDSLVVVDADNDQFLKTPMYYAYGHITKYVPRGSVRIASHTINEVFTVAFKRPDEMITIVALNNGTADQTLRIDDISTGQFIEYVMEASSIATIVYKPENLLGSPPST